MNSQHTPEEYAKSTAVEWFFDPSDDTIRETHPTHTPGISIARITCYGSFKVSEEKTANAQLIAAAPDLFAFAETVARSCCLRQFVSGKCICFSCEANELIAKAKGEK